jgi:predicted small metal-binding protein
MLKFECKELGTNCSNVAQGDTLDEVKKRTMLLAQTVHTDWPAKNPHHRLQIWTSP